MVILDKNYLNVLEEEIKEIIVLETINSGHSIYKRELLPKAHITWSANYQWSIKKLFQVLSFYLNEDFFLFPNFVHMDNKHEHV